MLRLPTKRFGRVLEGAAVATIVALAGVTAAAAPAGRATTDVAIGDDRPPTAVAPGPAAAIAAPPSPQGGLTDAVPGRRSGSGTTPPIITTDPPSTGPRPVTRSRPTTAARPVATTAAPTTPAPTPAPPGAATPATAAAPITAAPSTAAPTSTAPSPTTTTSAAAPTTTTAPPSASGATPLGAGAHLLFDDEFNGPLNTGVWETCWWYTNPSATGCPHDNGELQWYLRSDPVTSNGSLVLTANRQTVSGITPSGQPTTYNYTSGEVDTHGKISFQYGYVEWRAQVPAGQGLWPALWLLPADGSWPPEIDALEVIGSDPSTGVYTNHSPDGTSCGHTVHGADLSAAPHVFGVNWQPSGLTWYVDGTPVAQCTTANGGVSAKPMYLVMNLAVGGSMPGAPNASTAFPAKMSIDWVRVWK